MIPVTIVIQQQKYDHKKQIETDLQFTEFSYFFFTFSYFTYLLFDCFVFICVCVSSCFMGLVA